MSSFGHINLPLQNGPSVLVEATSLKKSFAGVQALQSADLELTAGEVHAVIGENGAGKSTLIKVITGALMADSGTLRIAGEIVSHNSPALARKLGVAAIYQQPSLFPHLTVAENIALALESGGLWRKVRWQERFLQARELLDQAGCDVPPERLAEELSMPEQQMVEIAKAIGAKARIVIMDEPTASLTEREVARLFESIRTLKKQGAGVIYISHRLEEISSIADRVTVLRDGRTIGTHRIDSVSREQLISMMVGRELSAVFPKRPVSMGDILLEARGLGSEEAGVRGISFSVRRGEILGISGLVGSGRTEMAKVLFGLSQADEGVILLHGRRVQIKSPADAIRLGICYVPEDRRRHGVVLQFPVTANTSLASLRLVSHRGLIDEPREVRLAASYVERLGIKTASVFTATGLLSGGNQQKVALARWLATGPELIILDEPTQGVDVGSKSEIHSLMVELAGQGKAIIMISSELPEILGMSDRILVMHEGSVAGIVSREAATQERLLSLALGHVEQVQ